MKKFYILIFIASFFTGCMNHTKNTDPIPEIADSTCYSLGEGALWDAESHRLFFVDILENKLIEMHPEKEIRIEHQMPSMIGTVVVQDDEHVLVALVDGIYRYKLSSREFEFLVCPPENDSTQRFNDGKCDPAGRFWVGSMSLGGGKETSHLFCMDRDARISVKLDGITISNGIVWSSDKKFMYYIDTPTRKVMEYAYDNKSGMISKPRVAVHVADSLGSPDGMAIDSEDRLWVCMWGGSAVCCFNRENGDLEERILVPAKNVTSCAFSGPDLNELYITTARVGTSEEELKQFPNAGSLFRVNIKTTGQENYRFKVNNIVF